MSDRSVRSIKQRDNLRRELFKFMLENMSDVELDPSRKINIHRTSMDYFLKEVAFPFFMERYFAGDMPFQYIQLFRTRASADDVGKNYIQKIHDTLFYGEGEVFSDSPVCLPPEGPSPPLMMGSL